MKRAEGMDPGELATQYQRTAKRMWVFACLTQGAWMATNYAGMSLGSPTLWLSLFFAGGSLIFARRWARLGRDPALSEMRIVPDPRGRIGGWISLLAGAIHAGVTWVLAAPPPWGPVMTNGLSTACIGFCLLNAFCPGRLVPRQSLASSRVAGDRS